MKKKLLIISLVVALVLTVIAPSPAVAASGKWTKGGWYHRPQSQSFSAGASLMVVDPGQSFQHGPFIFTRGEKVEGYFTAVDGWDALAGAGIQVDHASIIKLTPTSPVSGTYMGYARAFIRIALQSGNVLYGTYSATLQGEYSILDLGYGPQLVINYVLDDGTFSVRGRDGNTLVFGQGDWAAALFLTPIGGGVYTLVGDAEIGGTYTEYPTRW